ncbi:unnamed protein product [Protopolystoma xenopodis]|uniref:Uncharacterized protein n=1 Tax=Protopolystoma xenopodis TaxID=117903 RepID=A0A3S5A9Q0_9PLAT|nr:unnamed protein product [Protopolystoma xenopodis]
MAINLRLVDPAFDQHTLTAKRQFNHTQISFISLNSCTLSHPPPQGETVCLYRLASGQKSLLQTHTTPKSDRLSETPTNFSTAQMTYNADTRDEISDYRILEVEPEFIGSVRGSLKSEEELKSGDEETEGIGESGVIPTSVWPNELLSVKEKRFIFLIKVSSRDSINPL